MVKLDAETIQAMKAHAKQVVAAYGTRDTTLFQRYREMYFMEDDIKRPNNSKVDEKDWAITVSPSARNEVVGMVRLLDTSNVHVQVKDSGDVAQNSDKIEAGLKTILRVSGEYRRARVESDAALSAVLYGPVVMYFENVDDILAVTKNPYYQRQLEQIKKRTPVLIRTINAEQSYPEWGEFGMISHEWKYKVKGSALIQRWGVKESDVKKENDYTVHDIYDCENRLVYADNLKEPLFASAHEMTTIPIIVRYAGGSSLFPEPEKQMNSFLYAKAKSRLDKRENALLTAIATAINIRGMMGPLLAIDPDNAPATIKVDYQGGVRYIMAKAQQVDDKVIDPVVFQWKQLLDDIGGQSTIYKQTLGQNINASTFSSLAMLSSAGKLPLVDMQRAIETALQDIFLNILQRIKEDGIENTLITAEDIPDDVDIEVSLEPRLPQDNLRNAQMVTQLKASGANVSDEWINTNLLQIPDSNEMFRQRTKEEIRKAILGNIMQNPQLMQQFVMAAMGQGAQSQPPAQPEAMHTMPDGTMMPDNEMPPMSGQENMEAMPQTDAMIPPQERM